MLFSMNAIDILNVNDTFGKIIKDSVFDVNHVEIR